MLAVHVPDCLNTLILATKFIFCWDKMWPLALQDLALCLWMRQGFVLCLPRPCPGAVLSLGITRSFKAGDASSSTAHSQHDLVYNEWIRNYINSLYSACISVLRRRLDLVSLVAAAVKTGFKHKSKAQTFIPTSGLQPGVDPVPWTFAIVDKSYRKAKISEIKLQPKRLANPSASHKRPC